MATDRYEDAALAQLRSPAHDAEALAEVLADPNIGAFEVTCALNVTESEMSQRIETFFTEAGREDLLVLHLSCHGLKDAAGQLYFAAADTDLKLLRSTAVSSAFVSSLMAESRARRSVLLLDCCYSGAFERGMVHRAGERVDLQDQLSPVAAGRGRAVLTASSAIEYAFEGAALRTGTTSASPSIFTSAVVEGLRTGDADLDQDGVVDLDELYEYVVDHVRRATSKQTPHLWLYGLWGRLVIARRPTPVAVPAPLPHDLVVAIESALPGVRRATVPELARLARGVHLGLALAARQALEMLTQDDSRLVGSAAQTALGELSAAEQRETDPFAQLPSTPSPTHGPVNATVAPGLQRQRPAVPRNEVESQVHASPTTSHSARPPGRGRPGAVFGEAVAGSRLKVLALVAVSVVAAAIVTVASAVSTPDGFDVPEGTATRTATPTPSAGSSGSVGDLGSTRSNNCNFQAAGPAARDVTIPPTRANLALRSAAVTIVTNRGRIGVTLSDATPCTNTSFAHLAGTDFYDNTRCHRLTTSGVYVLQCGDPTGTGTGGPGYQFDEENLQNATYPRGTVAMAKLAAPGTTGSQFFLVYRDSPLPPQYTVFGRITTGLQVLERVATGGVAGGGSDGSPNTRITIQDVTIGK